MMVMTTNNSTNVNPFRRRPPEGSNPSAGQRRRSANPPDPMAGDNELWRGAVISVPFWLVNGPTSHTTQQPRPLDQAAGQCPKHAACHGGQTISRWPRRPSPSTATRRLFHTSVPGTGRQQEAAHQIAHPGGQLRGRYPSSQRPASASRSAAERRSQTRPGRHRTKREPTSANGKANGLSTCPPGRLFRSAFSSIIGGRCAETGAARVEKPWRPGQPAGAQQGGSPCRFQGGWARHSTAGQRPPGRCC